MPRSGFKYQVRRDLFAKAFTNWGSAGMRSLLILELIFLIVVFVLDGSAMEEEDDSDSVS